MKASVEMTWTEMTSLLLPCDDATRQRPLSLTVLMRSFVSRPLHRRESVQAGECGSLQLDLECAEQVFALSKEDKQLCCAKVVWRGKQCKTQTLISFMSLSLHVDGNIIFHNNTREAQWIIVSPKSYTCTSV